MSQGKTTEPNKLRNICCQILLGGSSRYIAKRLNCSASSVLNYTARLRYAGVDSLDQPNVLSDVQLYNIIYKQGKCLRACKKESLTIKQLSDNLTQSSAVLQPDYQKFANEYFDRHRKVQFLYTEWGCGQNPGLKPGVKFYIKSGYRLRYSLSCLGYPSSRVTLKQWPLIIDICN